MPFRSKKGTISGVFRFLPPFSYTRSESAFDGHGELGYHVGMFQPIGQVSQRHAEHSVKKVRNTLPFSPKMFCEPKQQPSQGDRISTSRPSSHINVFSWLLPPNRFSPSTCKLLSLLTVSIARDPPPTMPLFRVLLCRLAPARLQTHGPACLRADRRRLCCRS